MAAKVEAEAEIIVIEMRESDGGRRELRSCLIWLFQSERSSIFIFEGLVVADARHASRRLLFPRRGHY